MGYGFRLGLAFFVSVGVRVRVRISVTTGVRACVSQERACVYVCVIRECAGVCVP